MMRKVLVVGVLSLYGTAFAANYKPDTYSLRYGTDVSGKTPLYYYLSGDSLTASQGKYAEGFVGWKLSDDSTTAHVTFSQATVESPNADYHPSDARISSVELGLTKTFAVRESLDFNLHLALGKVQWKGKRRRAILGDPQECYPVTECVPVGPYSRTDQSLRLQLAADYRPWRLIHLFAGLGRRQMEFAGEIYQYGIEVRPTENLSLELRKFDDILVEGTTLGVTWRF